MVAYGLASLGVLPCERDIDSIAGVDYLFRIGGRNRFWRPEELFVGSHFASVQRGKFVFLEYRRLSADRIFDAASADAYLAAMSLPVRRKTRNRVRQHAVFGLSQLHDIVALLLVRSHIDLSIVFRQSYVLAPA